MSDSENIVSNDNQTEKYSYTAEQANPDVTIHLYAVEDKETNVRRTILREEKDDTRKQYELDLENKSGNASTRTRQYIIYNVSEENPSDKSQRGNPSQRQQPTRETNLQELSRNQNAEQQAETSVRQDQTQAHELIPNQEVGTSSPQRLEQLPSQRPNQPQEPQAQETYLREILQQVSVADQSQNQLGLSSQGPYQPPGQIPPQRRYLPDDAPQGLYPAREEFPPQNQPAPNGPYSPLPPYTPEGPPQGPYPPNGLPPRGSYPPQVPFPPVGPNPPHGPNPPDMPYPPDGQYPPQGTYIAEGARRGQFQHQGFNQPLESYQARNSRNFSGPFTMGSPPGPTTGPEQGLCLRRKLYIYNITPVLPKAIHT